MSSPPQQPLPPNTRRRGRPRSTVFMYFRRIVDDTGTFVGNKCNFCHFLSRDRSENPTYLTRHLLRICIAPPYVKLALASRYPLPHSLTYPSPSQLSRLQSQSPAPQTHHHQNINTHSDILPHLSDQHPFPSLFSPPASHPISLFHPHQTLSNSQNLLDFPNHPNPQQSLSQSPQLTQIPPISSSPLALSLTSPQTATPPPPPPHNSLRPQGITKARRGRPRSPALLHFHKNTDQNGLFVANQCIHCSFVSRDRSQNSTVLLRHLLSTSCCLPNHLRQALHQATSSSKATRKTATSLSIPTAPAHYSVISPPKPLSQRQHLVMSSLRFLLGFHLPLATAESPLFLDFIFRVATEFASQSDTDSDHPHRLADKMFAQLTQRELRSYFSNHSAIHTLGSANDAVPQSEATAQLFIYFANVSRHTMHSRGLPHVSSTSGVQPFEESAVNVASVFHVVPGSNLSFLASYNCHLKLSSSLEEIVHEAKEALNFRFTYVIVSRPLLNANEVSTIPPNDSTHFWITDIVRELDIICQELLAQVPFLKRVHRRNELLYSYFKEEYSEPVAQELFGRSQKEKQQFERYREMIAVAASHPMYTCRAVETASRTYDLLCQAQSIRDNQNRAEDTRKFFFSLSEEVCGSVAFSREIMRLVLFSSHCRDLKAFLAVMTPLIALISQYNIQREEAETLCGTFHPIDGPPELPVGLHCRSLSHVLRDCLGTVREIGSAELAEHESDKKLLHDHVRSRLIGDGSGGLPPIANELTYLAAFLHPNRVLMRTMGICVDDAWQKAVLFLKTHCNGRSEMEVKCILEQFEEFGDRRDRFSNSEIFEHLDNETDPLQWWERHGDVAAELKSVAVAALSIATTALPAVRYISEENALSDDLLGRERDTSEEKLRFVSWNLKLSMIGNKCESDCGAHSENGV